MTRTVFSTMTERASHQLDGAHAALLSGAHDANQGDTGQLAHQATELGDLTDALAHLGRTVHSGWASPDESPTERLVESLAERARRRRWDELAPAADPVVGGLREASRCIRAAADLWSTHRTLGGVPRSPEAARMHHPSMLGAALRHWLVLVGQSASVAEELVRLAGPEHLDLTRSLAGYPRPAQLPDRLTPVPLPLARPSAEEAGDILDVIDSRVDRVHRHVWEMAEQGRVTSTILLNTAAIGMLLARVTLHAEGWSGTSADSRLSRGTMPPSRPGTVHGSVTQRDLERWAAVAATVTPLRTPDAPTTVLQVERLDLARLLDRAMAEPTVRRRSTGSGGRVAARLAEASVQYRAVAEPCASSVRVLREQGLLFMAGRQLPRSLVARDQRLVRARLGDHLIPAPAAVARRLEAQLRAITAAPPNEGAAA